jgi:energy-coupling factor transporter ATP-binding protein EcfA2
MTQYPAITFEELVDSTYQRLLSTKSKAAITQENVRSILTNKKVPEILQNATPPHPAVKRLLVTRMYIRGRKPNFQSNRNQEFIYDQRLFPGLNGWVGENGTGKSSLLKAIAWAITGFSPNLKEDVKSWLEEANVEFQIDEALYTIRYYLGTTGPTVFGHIFRGSIQDTLNRIDEARRLATFNNAAEMTSVIAEFFGNDLGFSSIEWVTQSRRFSADLKRTVVSWDVFSQALVLSADDYTDFLFSHTQSKSPANQGQHLRTLSTLLELGLVDVVAKLELFHTQVTTNLDFEVRRLEANARDVHEKRQTLLIERELLRKRLEQYDGGKSVHESSEPLQYIRDKFAEATSLVVEIAALEQTYVTSESLLLNDKIRYEREVRELEDAKQSKYFLTGIVVERCPHCEHEIPDTSVEEEIRTGHCRVCNNELRLIRPEDHFEEEQARIRTFLKEVEKQIGVVRDEHALVETQLAEAQGAQEQLRRELADLPRQAHQGIELELRNLLTRLGRVEGQLESLEDYTDERLHQRKKELENEAFILGAAHKQLRDIVFRRNMSTITELERLTKEFALEFNLPHLQGVYLREDLELFVIQSGNKLSFGSLAPSERLRLKIAFHLALLALRVTEEKGRHPGFLIIDAPGSGELDDRNFAEILAGLNKIKQDLGENVQILIASARPALAQICDPNKITVVASGNKLF